MPDEESGPTTWVYVIGNADNQLVKIGTTGDLRRRLSQLQHSSPVKLTIKWSTEGGAELEAWLHRRFDEYRRHGEWFDFGRKDAVTLVCDAVQDIWLANGGADDADAALLAKQECLYILRQAATVLRAWLAGHPDLRTVRESCENLAWVFDNFARALHAAGRRLECIAPTESDHWHSAAGHAEGIFSDLDKLAGNRMRREQRDLERTRSTSLQRLDVHQWDDHTTAGRT